MINLPLNSSTASTPLVQAPYAGPNDELSLIENALYNPQKHHSVRVLCKQSFMLDVEDLDNPYWLVREFVQNFVDANKDENASTLNGVGCSVSKDTVDIKAPWSFDGYENLITFGTGKNLVDEWGNEIANLRKAGGIGIGIKQCALAMLRDKGIDSFEIQGKDWIVKYKLVEPKEINQKLKLKGINKEIKDSYFIAEVEKLDPAQTTCSYKLTASSSEGQEILRAFNHFHDLGEHENHLALQNMDFSCKHGSLKWLDDRKSIGTLFMNGQKRSYKSDNNDGSFRGGEGITITIHNELPRNFHRAAISQSTLSGFVSPIINQMNKEEAKTQLQKGSHLWSNSSWDRFESDKKGYQVIVDGLVDKLQEFDFSLKDLEKLFPDTKFICIERYLSNSDKSKLLASQAEDGKKLIVCPRSFTSIGVPLVNLDRASIDQPAARTYGIDTRELQSQIAWQSQHTGLPVNFDEIKGLSQATELFDLLDFRLNATGINEVVNCGNGLFRIYMNTKINKSLILNQFLNPNIYKDPIKSEAEHVLFLRNLAHYGIKHNVLHRSRSFLSGTFVDYIVSPGNPLTSELAIRTEENIHKKNDSDFIELQIRPEYSDEFKTRFLDKLASEKLRTIKTTNSNLEAKEAEIAQKPSRGILKRFKVDLDTFILGSIGTTVIGLIIWMGIVINSSQAKRSPPTPNDPIDRIAQEIDKTVSTSSKREPIDVYSYKIRKEETDKYANNGNTTDGTTLDEFTTREETAQVEANQGQELTEEQKRIEKLKTLLSSINNAPEDRIEDFKPLMYPSDLEKHKIALLKRFMYLATGIKQDYDLFIFEGKGAFGVNMTNKGGIGIHRKMIEAPFHESIGTLSHELGHEKEEGNYAHGDAVFHKRLKLLLSKTVGELLKIANKPISERTPRENELIDVSKQWNELNPVKDSALNK